MKNDKNYSKEIIISVALHLLLVVALLWGTDFTMSKPEPSGNLVQAVVIDPDMVRKQAAEIRRTREAAAKAEQERLDKLRRQSEQLEKDRKAEEARLRKLQEDKAKAAKAAREAEKQRQQEQERVKQEKARAAKAEAERKKAEAEKKKKQEELARAEQERVAKQEAIKKAEAERLAKEQAAREAEEKARLEQEKAKKAEAERIAKEKAAKEAAEKARQEKARLERLERERKEQEAAMNDIFAGLEQEAAQNMSAKARHVVSEQDRYGAIYRQLIQQNLLMEESFKGRSCKVNLRLLPTGTDMILSDVKVISGDSRLCAATKRAVAKVGSFPQPQDREIADKVRNINLTVAPE